MIVVPYKPEHLDIILEQPGQEFMRKYLSDKDYQKSLQVYGQSFSAIEGDDVLACAGLIKIWPGRALAWSVLSKNLRRNFLKIHYAVKRFLDASEYHRIEADCDIDFGCGRRWLEMLGFRFEGVLHKYTPDKRDCILFARVK